MEVVRQTSGKSGRRDTLNLRIRPDDRGLIDRAAALTGKTKTDFVIDAARRAAEDALLDRTLFIATPDAFDAFRARLDEPPRPNARLQRAMKTTPPWE
ncbi:DUF1778 domain-containing protein [Acidiphilium sp.]|uniref:type II toxin-antitoxin system TacA family antitoxin n=1 Tax=Acidiphilium sp. TaxID=527 RepID=UPI00258535E0|nr:DUF1778 domain-containing protein [Acidiphilium sp.]